MNLLRQMAEENLVNAIFLYTVITVVGCVALTLPGVTFAVLAGLLFGPVLGTICCSIATMIGAMAAFLAGRFFLKDSIKPVVSGFSLKPAGMKCLCSCDFSIKCLT